MQELRAFLAAEVAAGRGFFPPGRLVFNALRLTPLDAVRVVILGQDPYHGRGPGDGALRSPSRPASPPPPSLRNIFAELGTDLGLPTPATGDLTPWAERGVLLLNSVLTVAPRLPRLARRQGLGGVHRPRHRRALGPSRGDRLPPLGPLRAAEGGDRRHDPPPRAHGRAPVAVLGEQRLLRLPPLLPGQRPARGRRACRRSTGASPLSSVPGKRAAVEQRQRDVVAEPARGRPRYAPSSAGGREARCASEATSETRPASRSAHAVRSAVAPCPPTSDGALRQRSQPRSANGRDDCRGRPRRRGSARGGRAPARDRPPRPRPPPRRRSRAGRRSRATRPGTRSARPGFPRARARRDRCRRSRSDTPPSRDGGRAPSARPRRASRRTTRA